MTGGFGPSCNRGDGGGDGSNGSSSRPLRPPQLPSPLAFASSRRWLLQGVFLGCRWFVECPWQACDSQQNGRYSFFRRQQRPTAFAIASQYFSSHNSFILSNSSLLAAQLFINHFFFILRDSIYFCIVNISWVFFLFLFNHSFSFYLLLAKFFYIVHSQWVDFPGVLVVSAT